MTSRKKLIFSAVPFILAFLCYTFSTLSTTAPTSDEVPHLASGYVALRYGDRSLNAEHPPLAKILAAAPLLSFIEPPEDWSRNEWRTINEWEFGKEFLYRKGTNSQSTIDVARVPMILLGVFLCAACFVWSYRLFGLGGAVLSLCLCAFCPNILAHTRLITTDVPLAVFGVLSAFLLWDFVRKSSLQRALLLGISLGCMFSVKFSAVILFGGMLLALFFSLFLCLHEFDENLRKPGRFVVFALLIALASAIVLALSYGTPFFWTQYIEGVKSVGYNHNPDFLYYLLGHFKKGGFTWYFPVAFLMKSSPAVLLLLLLCVLLCFSKALKKQMLFSAASKLGLLLLAGPFLCYILFVCIYAPNIGYRYLIPALPFIYVAAGYLAAPLSKNLRGRCVLTAIVLLHFHAAWKAYPDPISYFNGLGGCSGFEAIKCLDDSNIDWGQNLNQLADALRGEEELALLYFGSVDLSAYFTKWRPMQKKEMLKPDNALYAFSIHGLNRWNELYAKANGVDWFKQYTPTKIIGNTYYVYDFREVH